MRTRMQRTRFSRTMDDAAAVTSKKENKENPEKRDFVEIGTQIYHTEDVEIPAYLRKRNQK